MNTARELWERGVRTLLQGGPRELAAQVRLLWALGKHRPVPGEPRMHRRNYLEWVRRYDTVTDQRRSELLARMSALRTRPRISVLMPTYNPRQEWLVEAIESVRAQLYHEWELCIADDASPQPHVQTVLRHYEQVDSRIKVAYRPTNGHISATSNSALALATGEWIALLDHDDLLPVDALLQVALAVDHCPDAQLIYSDEDKLGPRGRFGPYFKSDWNAELFRSQNMFSHLGVLRTERVRQVGGFRAGLEGSQDYDLVLRCLEGVRTDQIVHIPRVLYHWRTHEESTAASNDAKPYAQVAAVRALQEHFQRTGVEAVVQPAAPGYRAVYALPTPRPAVALVLLEAFRMPGRKLERAVRALLDAAGGLEVRLVLQGITSFDAAHARCVPGPSPADLLAAIEAERCTVVCILRAPVHPMNDGWLEELVRHACRPGIGLAGPMLLTSKGLIASAGVVLARDDVAGELRGLDAHAGYPSHYAGHGGRAQLVQAFSAVRDLCIAMPMAVLRALVAEDLVFHPDGGLRLSQAVWRQGLTVLWTPFSRVRVDGDTLARSPLGSVPLPGGRDPFYNPNLHTGEGDFTFAWPPRSERDA